MRNVVAQKFTKGINARLPIDRFDADPQRLHTLQNARISSRDGNTYFAKRIEGASPLTTEEYPVVLDVITYRNFVLILFKKDEDSTFHYIDIVDVTKTEEKVIPEPFVYSDINTKDIGKLILLEDTILVSPHNKMLNYIFGSWNFNDFVSTTPTIKANIIDAGTEGEDRSLFLAQLIVKSDVLNVVPPPTSSRGVITFKQRTEVLPAFGVRIIFKTSQTTDPIDVTIAIDEGRTITDVSLDIVNALNFESFFTDFWQAEAFNQSIIFRLNDVLLLDPDYDQQFNNLDLSIEIVSDDRDTRLEVIDLFDVENPVTCAVPNAARKCGKTFGGLASGSYGNVFIQIGKRDPIATRDFVYTDDRDAITAELVEKITEEIEPSGDYQVSVAEGEGDNVGFNVITIAALNPGLSFNLEPIRIDFPNNTIFFLVETKIINTGKNIVPGDFDTTKAYWYKARNVYFDGHKTKTCFPVYSRAEKNSDNIELIITPAKDIDGGYTDIEIFRKSDDSEFFFIKKITPQNVEPTQDYFVVESEPAYRYIYTRSQNFPTTETKTVSFSLGEYTTDVIELTPDDTEESFIQKLYDAFMALESFTSKWNIQISDIPRGVVISSSEITKSYNNIQLVPNDTGLDSMLRTPVAGLGVVQTLQENTDQILILPEVFPIKLFENDIISIRSLGGSVQFATLATDYEITETEKLIPIKETLETIEANSTVGFVSGEVFSDFALIRSLDVEDPFIRFYDIGFRDFYIIDEKDYIWSRHHYTQEIARDRYVRANVDYDLIEDVIPEFQFSLEEVQTTPQDNTSPFFTNGTLFAQARFQDGTTSFFEEIASFTTETESETFSIKQNNIVDENVKEYAFYAEYKPKNNPYIELNAASFSNALLPTEFSSKYKKSEDGEMDYRRALSFSLNPRLFVGFGRVKVSYLTDQGSRYQYDVPKTSVFEWLLNEETEEEEFTIGGRLTSEAMVFPEKQTLEYFGLKLDYVLESSSGTTATYILLPLLGLKTLSERVNLFYEIKEFSASSGGFGGAKVDEITNRKYRVVGYDLFKDPSAENDEYDGALFINLESNTPLDRIQTQITKKVLGASGDDEYDYDSHSFNLVIAQLGLFTPKFPSIQGRLIGMTIEELNVYGVDEKVTAGIFLGSKTNEPNELPIILRTGYDTDKRFYTFGSREVNVYFSKLQISNIYASIFLETDIPYQKENYPNQIIWSEPFVLNSNANGYRNFRPDAFLNIGADHGKIVGLEFVNGTLLVFTEHGLAFVNVGEVLTQQVGGQVFVNSSTFLNGYSWALKELPYVMPKTIVQYENSVFFCDGQDVWMYDGQLKNISQGAIKLNGLGFGGGTDGGVFMGSTDIFWGEPSRYMGEDGSPVGGFGQTSSGAWVGAVDPLNKEYRITDSFLTYAYSIEFGEWFGPYTYKDQGSNTLKNSMVSVVDERLVLQNTGSVFVEDNYETVIESVANLLDRPDMVKTWRKFYVDTQINGLEPSQYNENFINFEEYGENQTNPLTENFVTFGYRKHKYLPFENVDLAFAKIKNNSYNIGITRAHQNSEKLYWRISTNQPDFVLKMIAFEYMNRQRI